MNDQAIKLLSELLDAWVNGADPAAVDVVMARIGAFLNEHDRSAVEAVKGRYRAKVDCCGDPGDCGCKGYGHAV